MKVPKRLAVVVATLAILALAIGAVGALLAWEKRQDLLAFGRMVHRQLSQRVEQHDAHLTSLSALAQAAAPVPEDAIRQVSASIRQFYPRISGIEVVAFEGDGSRPLLSNEVPAEILEAARRSGAAATLFRSQSGLLLLTKRAGANPGRYHGIVLTLDPLRLMTPDQPVPEGAGLTLSLDGQSLARLGETAARARLVFNEALASRTQPLGLSVWGESGRWRMPSPWLVLLMTVLALSAGVLADRWLEASSRAREAARASARARLDARLAHAGRINAMGEMASGIAHELTQPLTAILSQAQAGQRLAQRQEPDMALIAAAFEASARNARRAGDILAKLRSWISQGEAPAVPVVVADVVADVAGLLRINGLPAGVSIDIDKSDASPVVLADRTQVEQVIFNLVRNAIDAVAGHAGQKRVRLALHERDGFGEIVIEDSGPGLSAESRARLFEPFYTTKPDGMGLGLALCLTLVERFGGTLTAGTASLGGAAFTVSLPLAGANRNEGKPA